MRFTFLTSILFKTWATISFEIFKLHCSVPKGKTNYEKDKKQKPQRKKQKHINNHHLTLP